MFKGNVVTAGISFAMSEFCFHIPVPVMSDVWYDSMLHFGDALPPKARRTEWCKQPTPYNRDGWRLGREQLWGKRGCTGERVREVRR